MTSRPESKRQMENTSRSQTVRRPSVMPSFTDSPAMSSFWPEKVMRIIRRSKGQKVSHGRKRTDSGDPEGREITVTDPYANIIVDISHEKLDKSFQYRIPEDMRGKLLPGMVVEIPFGRGDRLIKGLRHTEQRNRRRSSRNVSNAFMRFPQTALA